MAVSRTTLRDLDGRIVLVRSAKDTRYPSTGLRGTIEVQQQGADKQPLVRVVVDFPDMFNTASHDRVIPLDDPAVQQLLASERDGTYELVIDQALD